MVFCRSCSPDLSGIRWLLVSRSLPSVVIPCEHIGTIFVDCYVIIVILSLPNWVRGFLRATKQSYALNPAFIAIGETFWPSRYRKKDLSFGLPWETNFDVPSLFTPTGIGLEKKMEICRSQPHKDLEILKALE
jgi:hypothetical protein